MLNTDINQQLKKIQKAYDLTVEQYQKGINPFDSIPEEIINSPGFKAIMADKDKLNSGAPDIKEYLNPKSGMRFLDAGCCANPANYRLDKWQSTYYGVDISSALVNAMKSFAKKEDISVGSLKVADISKLPFADNFFDIATVIGVFEYCTIDYIKDSLAELNRVLKPHAKMVLDVPNLEHPDVSIMFKLEEYLGRPNKPNSRFAYEEALKPLFSIEKFDDTRVMIKYFVRNIK
jgi:cyclopropane fatty-acyl-phospholipid synthase-like methyltransferase